MSRNLFIDTSGWGNLLDADQPYHQQATTIYRSAVQSQQHIITTNYILNELVTLLTSPLRIPRSQVITMMTALKQSQAIEIVHIDTEIDQKAWQLLTNRSDKTWSLVDCASFVVMQQFALSDALTNDHHFRQAGFHVLLG